MDFAVQHVAYVGIPQDPTCVAVDPVQGLVAIGSQHGVVTILGQPGVSWTIRALGNKAVSHMCFIANKGILAFSLGQVLEVWDLRTKSCLSCRRLKSSITALDTPWGGSTFLFVGTDRGELKVAEVSRIGVTMSEYVVHRDAVLPRKRVATLVAVRPHPTDAHVLLLAYSTGCLAEWDLKQGRTTSRFTPQLDGLLDAAWRPDGAFAMASYAGGRITLWERSKPSAPAKSFFGGAAQRRPTTCVQWAMLPGAVNLILAMGGTKRDQPPGITAMHGTPISGAQLAAGAPQGSMTVAPSSPWPSAAEPCAVLAVGPGPVPALACDASGSDAPQQSAASLALLGRQAPAARGASADTCPRLAVYAADAGLSPLPLPPPLALHASMVTASVPLWGARGARLLERVAASVRWPGARAWPCMGGAFDGGAIPSGRLGLVTGHADGWVNVWDISAAQPRQVATLGWPRWEADDAAATTVPTVAPFEGSITALALDASGTHLWVASGQASPASSQATGVGSGANVDTRVHHLQWQSGNGAMAIRSSQVPRQAGSECTVVRDVVCTACHQSGSTFQARWRLTVDGGAVSRVTALTCVASGDTLQGAALQCLVCTEDGRVLLLCPLQQRSVAHVELASVPGVGGKPVSAVAYGSTAVIGTSTGHTVMVRLRGELQTGHLVPWNTKDGDAVVALLPLAAGGDPVTHVGHQPGDVACATVVVASRRQVSALKWPSGDTSARWSAPTDESVCSVHAFAWPPAPVDHDGSAVDTATRALPHGSRWLLCVTTQQGKVHVLHPTSLQPVADEPLDVHEHMDGWGTVVRTHQDPWTGHTWAWTHVNNVLRWSMGMADATLNAPFSDPCLFVDTIPLPEQPKSVLGALFSSSTNFEALFPQDEEDVMSANQLGGASANSSLLLQTMNRMREAVQERGQQLQDLAEKSAQLDAASAAFLSDVRRLKKGRGRRG